MEWKEALKQIDISRLPTREEKIKEAIDLVCDITGKDRDTVSNYFLREYRSYGVLPDQTKLYKVATRYRAAMKNGIPLSLLDSQLSEELGQAVRTIKYFRSIWGLVSPKYKPKSQKQVDSDSHKENIAKQLQELKDSLDRLFDIIRIAGLFDISIGKAFLILEERGRIEKGWKVSSDNGKFENRYKENGNDNSIT